jgi:hypothetical protein
MPPIPVYDFTTKDYGVADMIASMPDAFFSGYDRAQKRLKENQEADAKDRSFQSVFGLGGGEQDQNIVAQPSSPVAALGLGAPQQAQTSPRIDQAFADAQPKMPSFQAMQGGDMGDVKSKVYNSLIKNGVSPVAAIGLTGNLAQESGFRTDARNRGDGRDGSDSIGLAQWNQDRAKNLLGFAASKGLDWRDPDVQGAFIAHELKTTEGRAGQALAQAQTPEEAARAAIGYFRPAGFTWNNPMMAHGAENRIAQARRAAQEFGVSGQQTASAPAQGSTEAQGFVAPQQGQQPQQNSYAQQLMARAQALARQAQATGNRTLKDRAVEMHDKAIEAQQKETYGFQAFGDQLLRTDPRTGKTEVIMNKPSENKKPVLVQEYEYAKNNGFQGSIFDYQKAVEEAKRGGKGTGSELDKVAEREQAADKLGLQGEDRRLYLANGKVPAGSEKLTNDQANAGLYADRMRKSNAILEKPEIEGEALSLKQKAYSSIPVIGNYAVSNKFQLLDQARRDFINATLRRESGAVIQPVEFDNANKQYFPQPGDSAAVLAQKKANRQTAIDGISRAGGVSYSKENPAGTKANNAQQPQPSQITSEQQYQTLPSGAKYIDPQGQIRTKR